MTTFMICNLLGLSSTCTNPILYGYINQNLYDVLLDYIKNLHEKIGKEELQWIWLYLMGWIILTKIGPVIKCVCVWGGGKIIYLVFKYSIRGNKKIRFPSHGAKARSIQLWLLRLLYESNILNNKHQEDVYIFVVFYFVILLFKLFHSNKLIFWKLQIQRLKANRFFSKLLISKLIFWSGLIFNL